MQRSDLEWLIDQLAPLAAGNNQIFCFAHLYVDCLQHLEIRKILSGTDAAARISLKLPDVHSDVTTEEEPSLGFDLAQANTDYLDFVEAGDQFHDMRATVLAWLL